MKLTDLSFSYGEKTIFRDLTLSLPDAGVTALSGPSGCGKTTLLRLIAGLETPDSGTIECPPPSEIALMFQEDRLIPRLAARRQIALVRPKGHPAEHWLEAVGLGAELDTAPESLSGGMRRRLALARCLAYGQDKRLLLLDEPFTGVDADRIRALIVLIRDLGIPTLFTAHDAESLQMADTIVELPDRKES
ncbi:MAG: ATP-binding cassette domain-containing protein [Oscillospiraceae bacterium]|nr:ATP-binding cassette domain-containing protein [Oscillospiraceae bacterium]